MMTSRTTIVEPDTAESWLVSWEGGDAVVDAATHATIAAIDILPPTWITFQDIAGNTHMVVSLRLIAMERDGTI